MVFYRKYRPKTLEELDSDAVRERLSSILSAKDLAHAFLFTGPKGLGKTSAARIVAKVINCTGRTTNKKQLTSNKKSEVRSQKLSVGSIEPCNKCEQCISITSGTNFDVLEIDAASNRGIDEIRDLREKIRLSPMRASKKVYIIDEVHMLTAEAFDALLKTLEEPPSHAVFILCTTEPQKVPQTIVSRCVHILFNKATPAELVRAFLRIAKAEKLNIEKDVLSEIAALSDGSFRDGTKILEELVIVAGRKKITKKLLEVTFKTAGISTITADLISSLAKKDTKEALSEVSKLTEQGIDMKYFLEKLIETLHTLLLSQFGVVEEVNKTSLSSGEIRALIELLTGAYSQLKFAVLPQLPLELAIVEFCQEDSSARGPIAEEDSRLTHAPRDARDVRGPVQDEAGPAARQPHAFPTRLTRRGPPHGAPRLASPADVDGRQTSIAQRTGGAKTFLQELIEEVKPYNHSIAGVLRGCSVEIDGKKIIIKTGYKFHKERLEEAKTIKILEKVAGEIIGKGALVSVILEK